MPSCAPRPVPTRIETGTASPMAQGQAMIRTEIAATTAGASAGDGPSSSQSRKVSAESAMTTGTKIRVTRSTRACTGSLPACACSTSRTIPASLVSAPVAVTR